jgi:predicted dehydrogenase
MKGSATSEIGVGVVGLGFMGRTHIESYATARRAGRNGRLVAVCDRDVERRSGGNEGRGNIATGEKAAALFDPAEVRTYASADELFADPRVDLVSICTYTDTHSDLAIRALRAGKHVLVEKPVALRAADVRRVIDAARATDRLCMPAMCMRFWPGWDWLKQRIDDGSLGRVRSAVFGRLAAPPAWAPDFYRDPARTGGAIFDLHIHDADFVAWCFGRPDDISSTGTIDHITTLYRYRNGPPHVVAEGGWDHTPGFAFRMNYIAVFERATAEYDSQRAAPLLLTRDGRSEPVALEASTGWVGEVLHMLDAIAQGRRDLRATLEDAEAVTELLERERRGLVGR